MPQYTDVAPRDFHVSRSARDLYQFDETLFTQAGTVIFANFHAARLFAQKLNQRRDLVNFPEQAVRASQINALGLVHEITHFLFRKYREERNPNLLSEMLSALSTQHGTEGVEATLRRFADEFPPLPVYRREMDVQTYLAGETDGTPNREIMLEEMLMLWISNTNPAFMPFQELFDDSNLKKETSYLPLVGEIQTFLGNQPGFGPGGESILDALLAPVRAHPHSLEAQLDFLRQRWGAALGRYIYRLLTSLDLIKEEGKALFPSDGISADQIPVPWYGGPADPETENFSLDREWMPRLVMIAKNAYVWLDQLSKKYQRPIKTLADIPDEELDTLARWGFTGLWLIGLWERSRASKRIKQMMGNVDAVASAYSLYDYQIADALGGESACQNLRERAWQRGIRLASDMVPNHVGIDGRWVVEHPDWFVALDYPPYPAYTFNGPDLSEDGRAGIFLEDHYYDRTDAAVVFKRVDRGSGQEKFIYHGNDGTSMPWNDTAQLNYLNPEVREAVIQTILHVARQFPIIRFDAAMTLAKRHYHRLWFPEPGSGGDIASRSEFGLTKAEFDRLMPQEFWREVVERCATEAPDTLLLAEAFWLMESYFVRTLGMHRVYNSAFMHILRDEDNAKYRMLVKNTLEFDPEILKRYVNFMNNPDEKTAVEQFGKGDKYFGICTLLTTLPGLPMFGHGQVEGYYEKYGMEYQRAYYNEYPDQYLIERHEREIFPLVHKRYLFANVDHFLLYDFYSPDGMVNENVFAYSNGHGHERALVVYHNKYDHARGWVRISAAYSERGGDGRRLTRKTLGEGLGLTPADDRFCIFRDYTANLEYIRSSKELIEHGFYVELGAYQCHVFLEFREVQDDVTHQYAELAAYLNGRGVPSIEEAIRETFLRPIHHPLRELINADMFRRLTAARLPADGTGEPEALEPAEETGPTEERVMATDDQAAKPQAAQTPDSAPELAQEATEKATASLNQELIDEVDRKLLHFLREVKSFVGIDGDETSVAREVRADLEIILQHAQLAERFPDVDAPNYQAAITMLNDQLTADDLPRWGTIWSWLFVHALGHLTGGDDFAQQSLTWIDEWMLGRVISSTLSDLGIDEQETARAVVRVKRLTSQQNWFELGEADQLRALLESLLQDNAVRQLLQVNRSQGILWFNKEAFERMLWWLLFVAVVKISADDKRSPEQVTEEIGVCYEMIQALQDAADNAGYQVEKLLDLVSEAAV